MLAPNMAARFGMLRTTSMPSPSQPASAATMPAAAIRPAAAWRRRGEPAATSGCCRPRESAGPRWPPSCCRPLAVNPGNRRPVLRAGSGRVHCRSSRIAAGNQAASSARRHRCGQRPVHSFIHAGHCSRPQPPPRGRRGVDPQVSRARRPPQSRHLPIDSTSSPCRRVCASRSRRSSRNCVTLARWFVFRRQASVRAGAGAAGRSRGERRHAGDIPPVVAERTRMQTSVAGAQLGAVPQLGDPQPVERMHSQCRPRSGLRPCAHR